MATYIVLMNWTEQGVAEAGDSPNRANAAASALRKLGGRMKSVWWTMGPYDAVSIIEAPDDETVTAFALAVGAQGNARTVTMRAFDKPEMQKVLDRLK
ncbi:MAG TPA: GYD domain-containing protein [Acidimicrobiia bacterium]|nr:GYD domain-containing protein [Acidimicrobiia bacterium]